MPHSRQPHHSAIARETLPYEFTQQGHCLHAYIHKRVAFAVSLRQMGVHVFLNPFRQRHPVSPRNTAWFVLPSRVDDSDDILIQHERAGGSGWIVIQQSIIDCVVALV